MLPQFGEAADDQKVLSRRCRADLFVLQNPGIAVRNEHRVQSGGERRVDVRLRAVSDHPGRVVLQFIFVSQRGINFRIFLGNNFDGREVFVDTRALDLS